MARSGITLKAIGPYRRLAKSPYVAHNIILLAGTLLTGFCNYLLNPVLAHLLGLIAYGKIVSLLGLLAVLSVPIQVNTIIVAKYASALAATGNRAQLNDLVRRLTAILLPLGIGAAGVLMAASRPVATFLHLPSPRGVPIVGLAIILAFIVPVNGGALQGLQRFSWLSITNVSTPFARLVLVILLVQLGLGVDGALLGIALGAGFTYALSLYPLGGLLTGPRVSFGSLRPIWSYSATAAIALAGTVLLLNVDTILAGHFLRAREAGLYDALAVVGRTVQFVSTSFGMVMFPKVITLHERGERTTRILLQAMLGVLTLSALVEILFMVAPTTVMRVLFHQSSLGVVANQLALYGAAMLLLALAQTLISYFLSIGKRLFVVSVLACCALQTFLIIVRHQSIGDLVQAVVMTNVMLCTALFATFLVARSR